jgi:hypothetical protein
MGFPFQMTGSAQNGWNRAFLGKVLSEKDRLLAQTARKLYQEGKDSSSESECRLGQVLIAFRCRLGLLLVDACSYLLLVLYLMS